MKLRIQNYIPGIRTPKYEYFKIWAKEVFSYLPYKELSPRTEIVIRFMDIAEITKLNAAFKGKNTSTNILSFPNDITGDIAICPSVVNAEAKYMGIETLSYWSRIFVHGLLHLFGFNHNQKLEAETMESLEKKVIAGLRCK